MLIFWKREIIKKSEGSTSLRRMNKLFDYHYGGHSTGFSRQGQNPPQRHSFLLSTPLVSAESSYPSPPPEPQESSPSNPHNPRTQTSAPCSWTPAYCNQSPYSDPHIPQLALSNASTSKPSWLLSGATHQWCVVLSPTAASYFAAPGIPSPCNPWASPLEIHPSSAVARVHRTGPLWVSQAQNQRISPGRAAPRRTHRRCWC